jgi:hypothetical protein
LLLLLLLLSTTTRLSNVAADFSIGATAHFDELRLITFDRIKSKTIGINLNQPLDDSLLIAYHNRKLIAVDRKFGRELSG